MTIPFEFMLENWNWHRFFSDISAYSVRIILLLYLIYIILSVIDAVSTDRFATYTTQSRY